MISEEANRNNALLSRGPVTDAGRKRSSMNALRHGLTGQVTTMTDEDRTAHEKFSQALIWTSRPKAPWKPNSPSASRPTAGVVTFDEAVRPYPRNAPEKGNTCGRRISAIEDNLFALGLHEHGGKLHLEHEQIDATLTAARVFTMESKPSNS